MFVFSLAAIPSGVLREPQGTLLYCHIRNIEGRKQKKFLFGSYLKSRFIRTKKNTCLAIFTPFSGVDKKNILVFVFFGCCLNGHSSRIKKHFFHFTPFLGVKILSDSKSWWHKTKKFWLLRQQGQPKNNKEPITVFLQFSPVSLGLTVNLCFLAAILTAFYENQKTVFHYFPPFIKGWE